MHQMDGDDLGYILAVIIVIILPLFFIISSCAHNSGNRGSYTSYESVEEVRDYGRAIYYEGRWQQCKADGAEHGKSTPFVSSCRDQRLDWCTE